ncbi:hypothetical protein ABZX62_00205 [Streptomyces flavidovirens]|uniref:hypothetical protein n=1 Tax=Streptomyces flavidovirens TaxID=67298 RepID=UPI0033B12F65
MTRLQLAGRRLVVGHRLNVAKLTGWITEKSDIKSRASRAAILAAAAWVLWQATDRTPGILAPATLAWCWTAWRSGKPTPEDHRRQVLEGVLHLIGDRPGIFLRELYPALRSRPAAAHLDDAHLRAVLTWCGVTVHKGIRIGKETGLSGVKRKEVEALLSPAQEEDPDSDVDAGQPVPEGAVDPA